MWTRKARDLECGITALDDGSLYVRPGKEVYVDQWPLEAKKGNKMEKWLEGKKTILVQILAIAGAVGLYWKGDVTQEDFLTTLWAAATAMFMAIKVNRVKNGK